MMSVASKTKTKTYTTVILGLLVALSALPTWANTSLGIIPTVQTSVVSTQQTSNQDLSVLWTKLKERFSGVAEEVRSLVDGTTVSRVSLHGSAPRTIEVDTETPINPVNFGQNFFVDIENDPYRSYITRLSAYGVLSVSSKFYPQNYFRVEDFIGVLKKISIKQHINFPSEILSLTTDDGVMTKWILQQIISYFHMNTIHIDGDSYDKLMRSEWAYYLVRMFDLPILDIQEHTSIILQDVFVDIGWHPFAFAINTLANLAIITTETSKFSPDNYIRHYDFVVFFINSLLKSQNQHLADSVVSSFADVESTASYLSQLTYATDRGLIDDIVTSKRGQLYFEPNSFMTKHEVYQVLEKALNIQFSYDILQADTQKMTRAELAYFLVQTFWFEPKLSESESVSTGWLVDDTELFSKLKVLLSLL